MVPEISASDAIALLDDADWLFVDIRDAASHAQLQIPGSRRLSQLDWDRFDAEVPRQRKLVVYCYHGHSSLNATAFLQQQGYTAVSLHGGFEYWRQACAQHCVPGDQ
ncbi:rhodanese-like domain-containing protein [Isoalcanivorax beigongshangi]|uniref:Rhodanese-like domain-containing protein n=1 Tax=Isoalcanivorax beigongshangi TaxID=3238810 RepID=A0ABV4AFW5_9GAMM